MNFPLCRLTAPKQAMDLRLDAWITTGSLSSGGIHMRQRVPCCWKWHSSKLHNSTSSRFANRRSFFKRLNLLSIRLCHLGARLAKPESHLFKQSLALTNTELHVIAPVHMFRKELAVPQVADKTEFVRTFSQILLQRRPLPGCQRPWAAQSFTLAQPIKTMMFKGLDPALHCAAVLAEQLCDLLTIVTRSYQQQTVEPVVVPRFLRPLNFLLNGNTHHIGISNLQFSHDGGFMGKAPSV